MQPARWRRSLSEFSADWLALREPADAVARASRLTRAVAKVLAGEDVVRALDVATGTGANVRFLADCLPGPQDWLLVDQDPELLAQVPLQMRAWAARRRHDVIVEPGGLLIRGDGLVCHCRTRRIDLAVVNDASSFAGRALVTASALLDLVSEPWLRALADRCREHGSAVLFALTYDGRIQCSPAEPEDEMIRDLVNRHQRTDKGFGLALGPDGAERAERCFASAGYEVRREPSDWMLSPQARDLQRQLIDGWAQAAAHIAPGQSAAIKSWRARRLAHVADNRSQLIVGHQDLAAWLPTRRPVPPRSVDSSEWPEKSWFTGVNCGMSTRPFRAPWHLFRQRAV